MSTRWHPLGAKMSFERPEVGALIAYDHAAYRVIEVNEPPEDLWSDEERIAVAAGSRSRPYVAVVRPVSIGGDDPRARDHDLHLGARRALTQWWIYPTEHYPVCATCHEPLPCREVSATEQARQAIEHMGRFESPNVCPACEGLITIGQRRQTFNINLEIPGGPPVTFHLRQKCFPSAYRYEMRLRKAFPEAEPLLCGGLWRDTACDHGPAGCTSDDCPGSGAVHGERGCHYCPKPQRRRRATSGQCRHCSRPVRRDDTRSGLWVHVGTDLPRCAGADAVAMPRGIQP
jgi:hypothetical protein